MLPVLALIARFLGRKQRPVANQNSRGRRTAFLYFQALEDRCMPATILGWDVNGLSNFGPSPLAPTTVSPGVSQAIGLTRGSAVTTSGTAAGSAWGGNNWSTTTAAAGDAGNQFATF